MEELVEDGFFDMGARESFWSTTLTQGRRTSRWWSRKRGGTFWGVAVLGRFRVAGAQEEKGARWMWKEV